MYNSIGYSSTQDDILILRNLLDLSSKDGTMLIMQTENREWRMKNFEPLIVMDYEKIQMHEHWKFNSNDSRFEGILKFYEKKSQRLDFVQELPIILRLYTLHEMELLLSNSGWTLIKSFGDIGTLQQMSADSSEIVTVSINKNE